MKNSFCSCVNECLSGKMARRKGEGGQGMAKYAETVIRFNDLLGTKVIEVQRKPRSSQATQRTRYTSLMHKHTEKKIMQRTFSSVKRKRLKQ